MRIAQSADATLVRYQPSRSSGVAFVTVLGMVAAYTILGSNSNNAGIAALIGLIVVPVLAVGIPVYWTTRIERQPIATLGITTRRWLPSLVLSLVLSLFLVYPLWLSGRTVVPAERWLPMAAAGAVSLFEPLFIFGWLQVRFEKDFGVLPAILLAALGYALYHIGYLPGEMSGQLYSAVLFAVCFRLTNNLLVAWPLLWTTNSALLCMANNVCFYNWSMATFSGFVLVVELGFIAWMAFRQQRTTARVSRGGPGAAAVKG